MYEWISEIRNLEDWWKSTEKNDLQSDLSSIFSFRDSKIHLLKKIREKLHRIQSNTVSALINFSKIIQTDSKQHSQPIWKMLDIIKVQL